MCAIIGIVGAVPDQKIIERARDTMFHRGPDDAGLYYAPEEDVALGHRRLSIIDVSPAGHQPFVSHDGRYILVFNGEIYNFQELRRDLHNFYPFTTKSDTEVLIAAYAQWGKDALQHLRGMFAFAVWDKEKKTLFIARDRLGIKPLFYANTNGNFYFASEIKGILALSGIQPKLYAAGVSDYLSYRYVLGERTLFQNVYSLMPGFCMSVGVGTAPIIEQYWELPILSQKTDPGETIVLQEVERLIAEVTRSHMVSDVPVGVYLSGGLDSSVVTALMAAASKEPVKTFSIGFEEDGFHEFEYARKVAEAFATDHHEMVMHARDYFDLLPEMIRYKDAPLSIPNEVPVYVLSKELKKYITVVLSGEGADELFGGYGRIFRSGYDLERMRNLLDPAYLAGNGRAILEKNLKEKYGSIEPHSVLDHFLGEYSYMTFDEKRALLREQAFPGGSRELLNASFFGPYFERVKDMTIGEQYMYIFQKVHLLGPLHRLDVMAMAASVEARVPFVDHVLAEYISSLPFGYKLRWKSDADKHAARLLDSGNISEVYDVTKYLLRKIGAKLLPESIVRRKKIGFPVPLDRWFRDEYNAFARELLLSGDARTAPFLNQNVVKDWLDDTNGFSRQPRRGLHLWMLINLELWMREYRVS